MVKYLITAQVYKTNDRSKQTELVFYSAEGENQTDVAIGFAEHIEKDGYKVMKLISIVEKDKE